MTAYSPQPQPPAKRAETVPAAAAQEVLDGLRAYPELQEAAASASDVLADADTARHGRHLAALALVYLRHADAARAMVLALAAMAMGDLRPQTVLLVAEALLRAGDPRQALAVLSRFDQPEQHLDSPPQSAHLAARHYLTARVYERLGDRQAARAALDHALELAPPDPETPATDILP
ncbi:MAG: hypothetical protein Q4G24_08835 [Paracoccus sp. (in: a-proteobacteria)]|uniref:hypothetical protein n=1 Tax=Paracoccus sp. TaxID=267 RepID=UPI0026E082DC|nr:hypothetical protein [Paracoccus sp. (in: a-proteobacteria)]MDO5621559.1 hypothetical protein [Paracoccus sp. (in: a-proteobacteria)]